MAKDQGRFDSLIFSINSSNDGLIPCTPLESLTHEATSSEECEAFPLVVRQKNGLLSFWLSHRELTDDDADKLISSLVGNPAIAQKLWILRLDGNYLTKSPFVSKEDFPNLQWNGIGPQKLSASSEQSIISTISNLGFSYFFSGKDNTSKEPSAVVEENYLGELEDQLRTPLIKKKHKPV